MITHIQSLHILDRVERKRTQFKSNVSFNKNKLFIDERTGRTSHTALRSIFGSTMDKMKRKTRVREKREKHDKVTFSLNE